MKANDLIYKVINNFYYRKKDAKKRLQKTKASESSEIAKKFWRECANIQKLLVSVQN
jgi:hypothetical protein